MLHCLHRKSVYSVGFIYKKNSYHQFLIMLNQWWIQGTIWRSFPLWITMVPLGMVSFSKMSLLPKWMTFLIFLLFTSISLYTSISVLAPNSSPYTKSRFAGVRTTSDGFTHRPWPRVPRFWGPRVTLSYDDSLLTKNFAKLRRGITSQFTLKRAEKQMSTADSYEYSNNTTILCIWAWERCRPSLWKC